MTAQHDKILIVDFGSQVTQLIARRVRAEKVYCQSVPLQKAAEAVAAMKAKAVLFSAVIPVPPSCNGEQTMAHQLGGEVGGGHHREFRRPEVTVTEDTPLF